MEVEAKRHIQSKAKELGFDHCQISDGSKPDSRDHYNAWLQKGYHGKMAYLERNHEKRKDPALVVPDLKSVISLSTSYHQNDGQRPTEVNNKTTGIIARYARFRDYHDILAEKLKELTDEVTRSVSYKSHSLWYVDTGPILERDMAQRAGIGFVGKHTNLISRKLGNWFFISEILTTIPLPADSPEKNRCGTCQKCLTACPTQAISKPFELDARRCISYLTIELKESIPIELRPLVGNRIFGCDDCLAVCPWNRFAREGSIMKPFALDDPTDVDLETWAQIDPVTFKERFRGTPFFRTKWRGLMRNICVALGNIGTAKNIPTLTRLATNENALVSEHALWAIKQIQNRENDKTEAH